MFVFSVLTSLNICTAAFLGGVEGWVGTLLEAWLLPYAQWFVLAGVLGLAVDDIWWLPTLSLNTTNHEFVDTVLQSRVSLENEYILRILDANLVFVVAVISRHCWLNWVRLVRISHVLFY